MVSPGEEVIFSCNTTSGTVQWRINDLVYLGSSQLPAGNDLFNQTTLVVTMTTNASTYACAALLGASSNITTLFLAG